MHGPTLAADVDGDGRPDRAAVVYSAGAHEACGFVLRAWTGRGVLSTRVDGVFGKGPGTAAFAIRVLNAPSLAGFADIDAHAGAEAVVNVSEGASNIDFALFSVRAGRLVRLRIGILDTVDQGGFYEANGGVDCVGRATGEIVESGVGPISGGRRLFERRFYRLAGLWFREVRVVRKRVTVAQGDRLALSLPEFGRYAFPSCSLDVRGSRLG